MSDESTPSDRDTSDQARRKDRAPSSAGRPQHDPPASRPDAPAGNASAAAEQPAAPAAVAAPSAAPEAVAPAAAAAPPPRRSDLGVAIAVVGFLILAGGITYVWQQQQQQAQANAAVQVQVEQLRQQGQALSRQLSRLRQAQPATPAAVQALSGRVAALNSRVTALAHQQGPDLGRIQARLSALEQRQPTDLKAIQDQIKAVQQQLADTSRLSQQLDALTRQVQQVATRSQQADSALTQRLDTDESRLVTLEQGAGKISQLTDRANRLARLEFAQIALAHGQQLGAIPGAPPALARFADRPPPTVASLRLSFAAAARAAVAASTPDILGKPFLARMLAHAEQLVTVRQGSRVVVGDATANVLAGARANLDAGDLAAAVAAVAGLHGAPATAMAGWLDQAKALLAARAALAEMVAHT